MPEQNGINIYAEKPGPRHYFVCDLIFKHILGTYYSLSSDKEINHHIYYSENKTETSGIHIPVITDLLHLKGTKSIPVKTLNKGKEAILFPTDSNTGSYWNFDLFAAVFYLCSRYEEYEGFTPDIHGRFSPESSVLYKTESFEYPLVNLWVNRLKKQLLELWPDLHFDQKGFRFISSIDVDSTFQFRQKGFIWGTLGLLKDLVNLHTDLVWSRICTICRIKNDPFDVFDKIEGLHSKYNTEVIYFYLLGNKGEFDKNIKWNNSEQSKILHKLKKNHKIGIHPSYASNYSKDLLKEEMERYRLICGENPQISRQHFLMHRFPDTYENLIELGISEDHTMGYTSRRGFRAGIASPFPFYDLKKERTTSLMLFPFCSMDITPLHYEQISLDQAIEKNIELLQRVADAKGLFVSLWHNESLSGTLRWKGGWEKVYISMIEMASQLMQTSRQGDRSKDP
ncbi:MAG: polysaccharide deacetylase family protein [Flavobacteriales bacterium]|nr:polysaccharide deacetylase family protein [Flavobacteriales bacterium]